MSYAIIRNEKYTLNQLNVIYRHNERKNTNYSNKWFYAFVSDIRFESNNSCSCDLITDVFQTVDKQLTLKGLKRVADLFC